MPNLPLIKSNFNKTTMNGFGGSNRKLNLGSVDTNMRRNKILQEQKEIDTMLSSRPPTGLILNPLITNSMKIKFDHIGTPVQRSIIGKIEMY